MSHNFSWHTSNESNRLLSLLAVILCCVALLRSIYHIRDEKKKQLRRYTFYCINWLELQGIFFLFFFPSWYCFALSARRSESTLSYWVERSQSKVMHAFEYTNEDWTKNILCSSFDDQFEFSCCREYIIMIHYHWECSTQFSIFRITAGFCV